MQTHKQNGQDHKPKPRTELSLSSWFPHDTDALTDPKIGAMLYTHGAAGYGLFWHINELLHAEQDGRLPLKKWMITAIASSMKMQPDDVEKFINNCIDDYELYTRDGEFFTSKRVQKNVRARTEQREIKRENGSKGGQKKASNRVAPAKQQPSSSLAPAKQNVAHNSTVQDISIDMSVVLDLLNDSLKAEPSAEGLLRAFATGWPELSGEGLEIMQRAFMAMPPEQQRQACEALYLDLKAGGREELSEYLEI